MRNIYVITGVYAYVKPNCYFLILFLQQLSNKRIYIRFQKDVLCDSKLIFFPPLFQIRLTNEA